MEPSVPKGGDTGALCPRGTSSQGDRQKTKSKAVQNLVYAMEERNGGLRKSVLGSRC